MDEIAFQALLEDAMTGPLSAIATSLERIAEVMTQVSETLTTGFEAASESTAQLETTIAGLETSVSALDESMVAEAGSLMGLTDALETNTAAMQDNAAAADEDAASQDSAGKGAMGGAYRLGILGVAAAGAGAAMIYFGGKAQDSLNTVQAMAGATQDQMTTYTATLEQMSGQLGVTLDQAAQGLYYVVSAGFSGADATNVLRVAFMGAKAGGTDMKVVADALTSALNAYGAGANQATKYSDIMTEAVVQGKQTFENFAGAVGMAAVQGRLAKFSFAEVAAAEADMTQTGLNSRRAVMQLDFTMRAIGLSIPKVADAAKKLGLSFNETKYKSLDLIGKLAYLKAISGDNLAAFEKLVGGANGLSAASILLGNMTGKTAAEFLKLHTSAKGQDAAQKLLAKSGSHYLGILDKMHKSSGVTAKAFNTSEQTMSAHVAHATANLSLLAYNIATAVTPAINTVSDKISNGLAKAVDFMSHHADIARPILVGLAVIIGGLLVASLQPLIASMWAAATAEGAMFLPIMAITLAIAGLVTGFILAYTHIKPFHDAIENLKSALGGLVHFFQTNETAMDALKAVVAAIAVVVLAFALTSIPPLIVAFGGWAVGAASAAVATIAATWPILLIIAAIGLLIFIIIQVVKHWDQIRAAIERFAMAVFVNVVKIKMWIVQHFMAAWVLAQQAVHNAITFIQHILKAGLDLVIFIVTAPIRAIVALFLWLYNHNYYFKALVDAIVGFFKRAWAFIVGIWTAITTWLSHTWNAIKTRAEAAWHLLVATIQHAARMVYIWLVLHITAARVWLEQQWERIKATAQQAWSNFVKSISDAVGRVKKAIADVIQAIFGPIKGATDQAMQWGVNLIQNLINGIKSMAGKVGDAVKDIAKNIASFLGFHSPAEEGPGSTADEWMPNLIDMMTDGLTSRGGKLAAAAKAVAGSLAGAFGTGTGGGLSGASFSGVAGSSGSSGNVRITLDGGFGQAFRLLDPKTRQQLAQELSAEMSKQLGLQGRIPVYYTGSSK